MSNCLYFWRVITRTRWIDDTLKMCFHEAKLIFKNISEYVLELCMKMFRGTINLANLSILF